jgi:hypothetical protein
MAVLWYPPKSLTQFPYWLNAILIWRIIARGCGSAQVNKAAS